MSGTHHDRPRLAALSLLGLTVIWGSTFLVVKDAVERIAVLDFTFIRFAIAGAILFAVRPRALAGLSALERRHGVVLGLLVGMGFITQTVGLQYTASSVSGFITGLMVVFTPLVAWVLFGLRVDRTAWVGVAIATVGLALLALKGLSIGYGEALTLLASFLYGCYIVGLSQWATPQTAYGLTLLQVLTATVLSGVPALLDGGLESPADAGVWGAILYMAIPATVVAFMVQTWAQPQLQPTRAAVILTMEPVFAGIFGIAVGGDPLTWRVLAGGSLVVVAMLVVELGPRRSVDAALPRLEP